MTGAARRVAWAPEWASAWGEDEYGLFADFEYKKVVQRMRWIPPRRFLMGSPNDEPERYTDETQHEVELTQGYWLADTACTQALWVAVMGENPSIFERKDENSRPVEQVSLNECQEFLRRLNAQVPRLDFRLPTEAEWECACRAGTTTPFSFGASMSTTLANFQGESPYVGGGSKIKYRMQTVPVKSLPANQWGLFEMHGNVWEWCLDEYAPYNLGPVVDPVGCTNGESVRVIRGGSWKSEARYARSANRRGKRPHDRGNDLGFRLAQGRPIRVPSLQELREGDAERT